MKYAFGLEIEACGLTPKNIERLLTSKKIKAKRERLNHLPKKHWKVVSDISIELEKNLSFELVSPKLRPSQRSLLELKRVCQHLQASGCMTNNKCGLHIHIDANDFKPEEVLNIIGNYAYYEYLIDDLFPKHRRDDNSAHCFRVTDEYAGATTFEFDSSFADCDDKEKIELILDEFAISKYRKLNVQSLYEYGTIEFRQHEGTINYLDILMWLKFVQCFVAHFRNVKPRKLRKLDSNERCVLSLLRNNGGAAYWYTLKQQLPKRLAEISIETMDDIVYSIEQKGHARINKRVYTYAGGSSDIYYNWAGRHGYRAFWKHFPQDVKQHFLKRKIVFDAEKN